ncbi:MAG: hypothetical protein MI975_15185 [Cytophagales bacterium]|nr:hypothetical protein [Cytophagales bacterium]
MKKTFLILLLGCFGITYSQAKEGLKIRKIALGYPVPAIPYYHFKADLELPYESVIEVTANVNGKPVRFTNLYREGEFHDMNLPHQSHRPPSGYGLSENGTIYKNPSVTAWVKWEPGREYNIEIAVRLKKNIKASKNDIWISKTTRVKAPEGADVFDKAWKNYKSVVLTETAGIERVSEAVEVLLPFYPDEAFDIKREIRVVEVNPNTFELTETPSQVYDIRKYLEEDDMSPDENGNPTREVPLWFPTMSVRVDFLANVPAKSSGVYLIYYNNDKALAKVYNSDLKVQGEKPGLHIENKEFSVVLHPNSGHLDQITLKEKSGFPLFHRMETNGAIHWNPGIYSPPRPWTHTADWKPPQHTGLISGPVKTITEMWGNRRDIPEVDASVRYEFFPDVPYFISTTNMRINETIHCNALRNAEIVFKRELMTHATWYDVITDKIVKVDVRDMPELTDLKMEADVPWIVFYNEDEGVAFAGIQIEYANAGLENRVRLLNPFMYITGGPWIYWARALSLPFLSSNMQQLVPAMKGNSFTEKWAYMVYEIEDKNNPHQPIAEWQKRLLNPLRIQLNEEVDERVSRSVHEIYMEDGKSGWEGRETSKH